MRVPVCGRHNHHMEEFEKQLDEIVTEARRLGGRL